MPNRNRCASYPLVYTSLLPHLQEITRAHGYALGVHGVNPSYWVSVNLESLRINAYNRGEPFSWPVRVRVVPE